MHRHALQTQRTATPADQVHLQVCSWVSVSQWWLSWPPATPTMQVALLLRVSFQRWHWSRQVVRREMVLLSLLDTARQVVLVLQPLQRPRVNPVVEVVW